MIDPWIASAGTRLSIFGRVPEQFRVAPRRVLLARTFSSPAPTTILEVFSGDAPTPVRIECAATDSIGIEEIASNIPSTKRFRLIMRPDGCTPPAGLFELIVHADGAPTPIKVPVKLVISEG